MVLVMCNVVFFILMGTLKYSLTRKKALVLIPSSRYDDQFSKIYERMAYLKTYYNLEDRN